MEVETSPVDRSPTDRQLDGIGTTRTKTVESEDKHPQESDHDSGLDEPFDHNAVIEKLNELNLKTSDYDAERTPSITESVESLTARSMFGSVPPARETTYQLLLQMYEHDMSQNKVFLASKGFRTNESRSWYLPVVRTVEAQIAEDLTLNKEFAKNTTGLRAFVDAANRLILGADSPAFLTNRVSGIQTPGGAAALYVGLSVLRKIYNFTNIYIPNPTIGMYREIAGQLGYDVRDYEYLDENKYYLDTERFLDQLETNITMVICFLHHKLTIFPTFVGQDDLMIYSNCQSAREESIVVFHVDSTHRPSNQTWYKILDVMKRRHLFALFHVNAQGLASGDLYVDSFPVRLFVNENQDIMVAQSFSKIFGLGDEKIAHVCIVGPDTEETRLISANLRTTVNNMWGYTGGNAARIVVTIINNPALAAEWKEHIRTMAERVRMLRIMFFQKLLAAGTSWEHVHVQTGMFVSTGLTDSQVDILRTKYHIYIHINGFINLSCLTSANLDYVTSSIHDVIAEEYEYQSES